MTTIAYNKEWTDRSWGRMPKEIDEETKKLDAERAAQHAYLASLTVEEQELVNNVFSNKYGALAKDYIAYITNTSEGDEEYVNKLTNKFNAANYIKKFDILDTYKGELEMKARWAAKKAQNNANAAEKAAEKAAENARKAKLTANYADRFEILSEDDLKEDEAERFNKLPINEKINTYNKYQEYKASILAAQEAALQKVKTSSTSSWIPRFMQKKPLTTRGGRKTHKPRRNKRKTVRRR
jgi:hypothetical protein